jgi:hypothetical protein
MSNTAADLFLAAHPQYDPEHVQHIAQFADTNGIPYCTECNDWHFADEEHSATEGDLFNE